MAASFTLSSALVLDEQLVFGGSGLITAALPPDEPAAFASGSFRCGSAVVRESIYCTLAARLAANANRNS